MKKWIYLAAVVALIAVAGGLYLNWYFKNQSAKEKNTDNSVQTQNQTQSYTSDVTVENVGPNYLVASITLMGSTNPQYRLLLADDNVTVTLLKAGVSSSAKFSDLKSGDHLSVTTSVDLTKDKSGTVQSIQIKK